STSPRATSTVGTSSATIRRSLTELSLREIMAKAVLPPMQRSASKDPPMGAGPAQRERASVGLALEELLHLREEAQRVRGGLLVTFALELVEQLALAPGQVLGRLDFDLNVHVAGHFRTQHRHALALEAELLAGFRSLGNFHACLAAIHGRHINVAAERSSGH